MQSPDEPRVNVDAAAATTVSEDEAEEQRQIRRLQFMMNMVMQCIAQDGSMTVDEASQMVADARAAALEHVSG
jgi:hypothetical protein